MSSTAEDPCSHCKKHHSLASCPMLEEQQRQAYSQADTSTSTATAGIQVSDGSAAMQATGSNTAHPMEGLTYNGGAYLCADTNNAISDNNNSDANGSVSMAPPDPYANTYPTTLGSSSLVSAIGNRFSWADRRSTSAGTVSGGETPSGNNTANVKNNNDFNLQRRSQPNGSTCSPIKQESRPRFPSLPPVLDPRGNNNNNGFNIQHPSQNNGNIHNANQREFQLRLPSFSPAPAPRSTSTSNNNVHDRTADRDAASQYGGFSTSDCQEYSSPARPRTSGLLPTPIRSYVPSSNHGQYLRPLSIFNDQRTLPGPYRYTGYANDPAADSSSSSYGRPANGNAASLDVKDPHNIFIIEEVDFHQAVNAQSGAPGDHYIGHNPDLSNTPGQRGYYSGQNGNLVGDETRLALEYQRHYEAQAASPVEQCFNLRPMPQEPHMEDYAHTPTFAVECLKNYAKDLQSWAFELSLHTTRLEKLLDLPGRLVWERDSSFKAKLILERTPANRELFNAAIAAGNSATKALIQSRNSATSMNVSPPLPLNFLAAGQEPLGSAMGTENNSPDGTPVKGTGRGRGHGSAARGGRAAPANRKAPAKRKSATQDTEDGEDMMSGDNTGSSTAAKKAPARKRVAAKKVKSEPASDPVDIPERQSGYYSLPVLAAKPPGMVDDRDLDAEGETDEEWFESQRRNVLGFN
ncbi:hypothetical protein DL98DRAFT_637934 [Cadophora sp. DSE1049]|nr:hypothetical protein DL98DRAFT_637934 [Cadophora sp. DSE1049]